MNILSKDILPLKTSQKFSSVLEPYAVKVASTVLRRECHCEVMFLSDYIGLTNISKGICKASDRFLTIVRDKDIFLFKSSDTLLLFPI